MAIPSFTYQEFNPNPLLKPFVKCYGIFEYNMTENQRINNIYIPFGSPYITISYKGRIESYKTPFPPKDFVNHQVGGQMKEYFSYSHSGNSGLLGIVFQPIGFYYLFKKRMYEFTQKAFDVKDVLGQKGAIFIEELKAANSNRERIFLTEKFLIENLGRASIKMDDCDHTLELIRLNPGLPLDDITRYLKVTSRHLRRIFKEKVGIGPKYYQKICRIHRILQLTQEDGDFDLLELAFYCGYFDQSHFIKDFKQFTGKTPFQYFNKNSRRLEIAGIHIKN